MDWSETEQIYRAVDDAWEKAGLARRRVFDTPGYEHAVAAIKRYCASVGWTASPMGPVARDTWSHWVHILSHTLEDSGHGLRHAKVELELAELAIAALQTVND